MRNRIAGLLGLTCLISVSAVQAQVTLSTLNSFGGGDGWFAPGEGGYTFLGTANNERGLAYGNGHLYLVSRNGGSNIRVLDPLAGTDLGIPLNVTGVSGGTFAVNNIAVGADGAIYVGNLTTQSTTTPYKVYRWATEGSVPAVAYTGDANLPGSRVGDNLAAIGSGSSTRLAAGFNSTPSVAGNNGFSVIDPTAGAATAVGFGGTPPNAGDFRLGITFVDPAHVLGTAGSSLYRYASFSGSAGTLLASPAIPDPAGATADRLLGYTVLGGKPLLAVQSIGDSHVSLYDVSDPANPIYLASRNNTSGTLTANGNGTGEIAWGDATYNPADGTWSANLYTMSSNQGIQAFIVTVPEPGVCSLLLLGLAGFGLVRKHRK